MPPEPTPQGARAEIAPPLPVAAVEEEGPDEPGLERQPRRRRARSAAAQARRCAAGASGRSCSSLLVVNYWAASTFPDKPARARIAYSPQFLSEVKDNNVSQVTITEQNIEGEFKSAVTIEKKKFTRFSTNQPALPTDDTLLALLKDKKVEINAKSPDSGRGLLGQILLGFGPTLLILAIIIFAMRRAHVAGGGALRSLGRSRGQALRGHASGSRSRTSRASRRPSRSSSRSSTSSRTPRSTAPLGGKIPRGVLLSGPPGTGKTLLARAVAGEAGVPFFSASASEFVEMIVGVGASRVRDLFEQAKAAAAGDRLHRRARRDRPLRAAAAPISAAHDEREQTLNQILTEMDGFSPNSGVIVLAATNRPDVLDKALLRPGPLRPPRRPCSRPTGRAGSRSCRCTRARCRSRPTSISARSPRRRPGMVGADLANLVNEAALLAARRSHESVEMADFTDAAREDRARAPSAA